MDDAIQTILIELKLKGLSRRNNLRRSSKEEAFVHTRKVTFLFKTLISFVRCLVPLVWTFDVVHSSFKGSADGLLACFIARFTCGSC